MATKKPKSRFRTVRDRSRTVDSVSPDNHSSALYKTRFDQKFQSKTTDSHLSPKGSSIIKKDRLSHKRNPSQSVMVRLKRLDTLRLNQRIKVKDYGYGSIQFLGCVHFAQGLFVGVELDEANGKHDGSYHGKRYFTAKEKHGVLVKQHRVELLDIEQKGDDLFDLNNMNMSDYLFNEETADNDEAETKKQEQNNKKVNEEQTIIINELKIKNKKLNDKIEEYIQSVDDLEIENEELKKEKLNFETEMNAKIEELEDQLQQIRVQLNTKDEVLKKEMAKHHNTKTKFRKKIEDFNELKQKNQNTVELILYGERLKDDIIEQYKQKEKKHLEDKKERILEMERINIATQEKLNKKVEEWIFDYGDAY